MTQFNISEFIQYCNKEVKFMTCTGFENLSRHNTSNIKYHTTNKILEHKPNPALVITTVSELDSMLKHLGNKALVTVAYKINNGSIRYSSFIGATHLNHNGCMSSVETLQHVNPHTTLCSTKDGSIVNDRVTFNRMTTINLNNVYAVYVDNTLYLVK